MSALAILASVLVQWLPASWLVHRLLPLGLPARAALVAGYGLLLGMLLSAGVLVLLDSVGLMLRPVWLVLAQCILCAVLGTFVLPRLNPATVMPPLDTALPGGIGQRFLLAFLLLLIAAHFLLVGIELWLRPLYPWDATSAWATKARVWVDSQSLAAFVDKSIWYDAAAGSGLFTDHRWNYPRVTPLLQTWACLFLGDWDSRLMNVSWLSCLLAFALIFYGHARLLGAGLITAVAFTYFLVSMPLINTHVALAGYADLFMATVFGAALMAFHRWVVAREPWAGFLALLLLLVCPLVKNEGLYWAAALLVGLLVVLVPGRRGLMVLVALFLGLLVLLALFPKEQVVAGHSLAQMNIYLRPEALLPLLKTFAWYNNWHLLVYLFAGVTLLAVWGGRLSADLLPVAAACAGVLLLLIFLFAFTGYAPASTKYTAVARISFSLVPAILYLSLLLWLSLQGSGEVRRGGDADSKTRSAQD